MNNPRYQLTAGEKLHSYQFNSEGPKGIIVKRIQFTLVNKEGIYNLGFGDQIAGTEEIDDQIVSNNGDSEKVLATVVSAVFAFLDRYPNAWIFAAGSTTARTRLYQIGIARFLNEIKEELEIYGQVGNEWHSFQRGKNYNTFLARRKKA